MNHCQPSSSALPAVSMALAAPASDTSFCACCASIVLAALMDGAANIKAATGTNPSRARKRCRTRIGRSPSRFGDCNDASTAQRPLVSSPSAALRVDGGNVGLKKSAENEFGTVEITHRPFSIGGLIVAQVGVAGTAAAGCAAGQSVANRQHHPGFAGHIFAT